MIKLFYMKRILLFSFVTVWISSVFTFCATRTYSSENGVYVGDTLVKSGNRFVGYLLVMEAQWQRYLRSSRPCL